MLLKQFHQVCRVFSFCHCHFITHFQEVNDLVEFVSIFIIVKESYHGPILGYQHCRSAPVSVHVATGPFILAGAKEWNFIVDNQIDISIILRQIRVAGYHDSRLSASEFS